jgi:hypothetical protein
VHVFLSARLDGDVLRIASLNRDWLERLIAKQHLTIPNVRSDNVLLLTAETDDLQRLLLDHAKDEGALAEPGELRRRR